MYSFRCEDAPQVQTLRVTLFADDDRPLSFAEAIEGWRSDPAFTAAWNELLIELPFKACFWESPPLTMQALQRPFECVFINSRSLSKTSDDPTPFIRQFSAEVESFSTSFRNLSGDAMLVAPTPASVNTLYAHLLAFARTTSAEQSEAFWKQVAEMLNAEISEIPLWLSTAGLAVSWLHVRLDSQPKYYQHEPYAEEDFWGSAPA